MEGPAGSPFEGGLFALQVVLPDEPRKSVQLHEWPRDIEDIHHPYMF